MPKGKWTDAAPDKRLEALLDAVNNACSVSETAQQVMTLTQAGEVSLSAVVDAVMKDPELAKELLRFANSPLFGQTRKVHDIKRAVIVVGMQEVHNIAAAMSMVAAFSTPDPLSKRLRDIAVLSAAVARLLARHYRDVDEAQAFLSGLLSEIGAMACVVVDSTKYHEIWETSRGEYYERAAKERDRYVVQSEVIGAHVLQANHLPDEVAAAVGATAIDAGRLTRITIFSRRVAPLIVRAANESDPKILNEDIPALFASLALPNISKDNLIDICIQAGATAELSLRGELSLAEDDTADDVSEAPPKFNDPASFDINEIALAETEARKTLAFETINAAKTSPVRFVKNSRSHMPVFLIVGVGLITAVLAVAGYWFFSH